MNYAIECKDVSVRFKKYAEKERFLRWVIKDLFKKPHRNEYFWALKDVSFKVKQGETFGIIGENGSGKSTLLKLLTGILRPDSGSISMQGRVSALLELGAGFQADLTAKENIFLNGSILGLTRSEITKKMKEIINFSELEAFIDTPIKHYSSGMYMRLGFSIAVHVNPEILLIDEVLAVGDQAFQQKCMDKIREFKKRGKTIVLVSHDLSSISQLCSKAIWLKSGQVEVRGSTQRVIEFYRSHFQETEAARLTEDHQTAEECMRERWGSREIEIQKVEFIDKHGQASRSFRTGDPFKARIQYEAKGTIEKPVFGVAIHRNDGTHINGPNTKFSNMVPDFVHGRGAIFYEIDVLPLLPGTYYFSAVVYNYACDHPYDHHDQLYPFQVLPGCTDEEYGVFWIDSKWSYEGQHGEIIP